jgi:hypothetical protein
LDGSIVSTIFLLKGSDREQRATFPLAHHYPSIFSMRFANAHSIELILVVPVTSTDYHILNPWNNKNLSQGYSLRAAMSISLDPHPTPDCALSDAIR